MEANPPKSHAKVTTHGIALPRIGLLGNPSDGYGGRCLAFTFNAFMARVKITLKPDQETTIDGPVGLQNLVRAGLAEATSIGLKFPRNTGAHIGIETDIPRQVGFSGSSAVIIAFLRAFAALNERTIDDGALAACAWRAEAQGLGISCGPLDRAVQTLEGLAYFDFEHDLPTLKAESISPDRMPAVFLAWDPRGGESSGDVHALVQERAARGEQEVLDAMAAIARLADSGRTLLTDSLAVDRLIPELADLFDQNFELRASVFPITTRDQGLIDTARGHGAGAKLAGSGGAIVGIPRDANKLSPLKRAYESQGFRYLVPQIGSKT